MKADKKYGMIPKDKWLSSFEKWHFISIYNSAKDGVCGYCRHYHHDWVFDYGLALCVCPLKGKTCGTSRSHFIKSLDAGDKWARYHARKIFNAIAEHGKQYVGEKEQRMIDEVNKAGSARKED